MPVIAWDSVCSLSPAESFRQYARRTHDAGRSYNQIARELNTSHAAVRMALRPSEWKGTPEEAPPVAVAPDGPEIETSVFLSDLHVPSHDRQAVNVVLKFIGWLQPQTVFLVGDIFDCYQLSKYDKSPKRALELQEDLDALEEFFQALRRTVGKKTAIHYMEGNHERRLITWLHKHPEVCGLKALEPQNLFRLNEYGIEWHPQEKTYSHHGFVITHGNCVRKHAGQSAMGEFEKYMASGLSGHTHRLGAYLRTTLNGVYSWTEIGCLCDLRPEYVVGVPNWQHGFAIGQFLKGDSRFTLEPIPVVNHKFIYQGRVFS